MAMRLRRRSSKVNEEHIPNPIMQPEGRRPDHLARLIVVPLLLILLGVVLTFYVVFSFSRVAGESMLPALRPDDRFLMTKGYRNPQRGDIVVFGRGMFAGEKGGLIKRVVAGPGDRVHVTGGVVVVNGLPERTQDIIPDPADTTFMGPLVVPEDSVFVMGDNRPISYDSRHIGTVPLSSVAGRVVAIWAPINRIQSF